MATITRTLNAQQANGLRGYLLSYEYVDCAERLMRAADTAGDDAETVPAIRQAHQALVDVAEVIDQIGWQVGVPDTVEFTADEDQLRQWVGGAFDRARERVGTYNDLAMSRRWLDEAEALESLLDSLDGEPATEAA